MVKFVLLLLLSASTFASDITVSTVNAIPVSRFPLGVGSTVNLKTEDKLIAGEAVFLGNVARPDGSESYQMYLNPKSKSVYYIDSTYFARKNSRLQNVFDPYEQVGGTCTGYAINGFLNQLNYTQLPGTEALSTTLSTEEGRTQLLVGAINEYYLTPAHQYSIRGILNGYGKKFGFKCTMTKTEEYAKAQKLVLSQLSLGLPVIVSFNIGPKMVKSPFPLKVYDNDKVEMDERLWIPRKVGERNSGGHTIVAAGSFVFENKTYLVMIDSDWNEPRIWDMETFLNDKKTALDEIEFITCK